MHASILLKLAYARRFVKSPLLSVKGGSRFTEILATYWKAYARMGALPSERALLTCHLILCDNAKKAKAIVGYRLTLDGSDQE
jgi:hypothetical protein